MEEIAKDAERIGGPMMKITPEGFFVDEVPPVPGFPKVGVRAQIVSGSLAGHVGEVLGYSRPHGYVVLSGDGEELLVHPETVEVLK